MFLELFPEQQRCPGNAVQGNPPLHNNTHERQNTAHSTRPKADARKHRGPAHRHFYRHRARREPQYPCWQINSPPTYRRITTKDILGLPRQASTRASHLTRQCEASGTTSTDRRGEKNKQSLTHSLTHTQTQTRRTSRGHMHTSGAPRHTASTVALPDGCSRQGRETTCRICCPGLS